MPVDICRPPAGKRSLTRTTGASSFDIFRSKTDPPYATPFATRVYNDSVVEDRNPFLEAARDIDDDGYIKPSRLNRPVNPAFARGASHIRFGECLTPQEADASLKRRPGSECRHRDLGGNRIFEGPYPVTENCGGDGSDITGCCPKRPVSSNKVQELSGHNVFAIANESDTPPPPPRVPYMPEERVIPPHDMPRNPKKNESHMQIGGPVCVEPRRPSTCPSTSLAAYDILYNGAGNDVITRARQVEEMKMRAFQGNHIFDFNDEPRNEAEDEEHFSISKLARRRDIRGNDIFGEGRRNNPWNLRAPGPCGKRHVGPCSRQSMVVDPQALRVNDPARYLTASVPDSCNG